MTPTCQQALNFILPSYWEVMLEVKSSPQHPTQGSMRGGPGGGGGARGQNLIHIQKVKFLEVNILTTPCQKALILAPYLHFRVNVYSTTFNPWVHVGDGARGQNLVHIQKIGFMRQSFLEAYILATTCQKAFILGP